MHPRKIKHRRNASRKFPHYVTCRTIDGTAYWGDGYWAFDARDRLYVTAAEGQAVVAAEQDRNRSRELDDKHGHLTVRNR